MHARQGVTLNHGKPIRPDAAAPASASSPGKTSDGGTKNRKMRDAALQQGLRAAYRTVIEEPLPDRLLMLLQQLDGDGPR